MRTAAGVLNTTVKCSRGASAKHLWWCAKGLSQECTNVFDISTPRYISVILAQMLAGHCRRLQFTTDHQASDCELCSAAYGVGVKDTVQHMIMHCPRTAVPRGEFEKEHGVIEKISEFFQHHESACNFIEHCVNSGCCQRTNMIDGLAQDDVSSFCSEIDRGSEAEIASVGDELPTGV